MEKICHNIGIGNSSFPHANTYTRNVASICISSHNISHILNMETWKLPRSCANELAHKNFQKNTRSDIKILKYSSIQVFKYFSIQVSSLITYLLINNVKARDPVGSKN